MAEAVLFNLQKSHDLVTRDRMHSGKQAQSSAGGVRPSVVLKADNPGSVRVEVSLSCGDGNWVGMEGIAGTRSAALVSKSIATLRTQRRDCVVQRKEAGGLEFLKRWRIRAVLHLVGTRREVYGAQRVQSAGFVYCDLAAKKARDGNAGDDHRDKDHHTQISENQPHQ